jgi:hypothetical protein
VSEHHPESENVQSPDHDRETAQPERTQESNTTKPGSSADGGNCAVWALIGCLGVTLAVALIAFTGGIIYLITSDDNGPPSSATPTPVISEEQFVDDADPVEDDSVEETDQAQDDSDDGTDTVQEDTDDSMDPVQEDTDDSIDPDEQPLSGFGPGLMTVGEDIEPGIYFANEAEEFCYFERLQGFSGEFEDIIANEILDDRGIVEIFESDAGFHSERCGDWVSEPGEVRDDPSAPLERGTFLVGDEVEPGTWQAEGGENCYWARLSGFSATLDDVITNDYGTTDPVVEISAEDAGFHSADCGTWSRTSDQ